MYCIPPHKNPILAAAGFNATIENRFWAKVKKTSACWLFLGNKTWNGYGTIGVSGYVNRLAHHVSWILHKGAIPEGLKVLHHCDVRNCVRPDHLWLGTVAENQQDMVKKGRSANGEKAGNAKLTWKKVDKIRADYATGKYFQHDLAKKYGVLSQEIQRIVRGKRWRKQGAQYFEGKPRLPIGTEKVLSKLTDKAVKDIRQNYEPWKCPLRHFAEKYKVTIATVHHALHCDTWKHV